MADERKRCPKCGADFDHMVCDGEVLQFNCGTLQGRTRTERVIESEDCLRRQLAQAQERVETAEARIAQLLAVVKQVEWRGYDPSENGDVCPWCSWEKRDGHALDCELDAALSSAPENPVAAVVEAARKLAVAAEQVLKAWDMDADVSDAIEELREAELDYAALSLIFGYPGEPEFEVEVIEIEDQLEAGAPRQSDFEGPTSSAHPCMTSASDDGGEAPLATWEVAENARSEEGRE